MAATWIRISYGAIVLLKLRVIPYKRCQVSVIRSMLPNALSAMSSQCRYFSNIKTEGDSGCNSTTSADTEVSPNDAIIGPSDNLMQSLSTDEQKRLKIIWMEVEVLRQSGSEVPMVFTDENWTTLMSYQSYAQRSRYCRFLLIKEARRLTDKKRKEKRRLLREEAERERQNQENEQVEDEFRYGLGGNTIFQRVKELTMYQVYNQWACQALLYGPTMVLDLDYDEYMRNTDCQNCADQILMGYGYNRVHRRQLHLHLCNAKPTDRTLRCLERGLPNIYLHSCLMSVTPECYLDVYPKERIVYLTPHAGNVLHKYNHDDIYVIGGFVDKSVDKPLSLAKAKKEGIRMAKLPLDDYLMWGQAGKVLTIDQIIKIMVDVMNTGSWDEAFKHVPRRKLKTAEDLESAAYKSVLKRKPKSSVDIKDINWSHLPAVKFVK